MVTIIICLFPSVSVSVPYKIPSNWKILGLSPSLSFSLSDLNSSDMICWVSHTHHPFKHPWICLSAGPCYFLSSSYSFMLHLWSSSSWFFFFLPKDWESERLATHIPLEASKCFQPDQYYEVQQKEPMLSSWQYQVLCICACDKKCHGERGRGHQKVFQKRSNSSCSSI